MRIDNTRRNMLKVAAAAVALPPLTGRAADERPLRAAITGFNVINTLDPGKASLVPEFYVIWACFNGLVKFDPKMEIVPDLAESFRVVDPNTLQFKLRPGVRFHDQSVLSADDVKFTLERVIDEKFASPSRSKFTSISNIRIVNPLTIEISTKQAFAPLLTYLTNTRTGAQIVSRKAAEAAGADFGRQPVGTGAYGVRNWKSNESVELGAHRDYFVKGQPGFERIAMPLIAEESSGSTAILGGQVDITSTAPFADIPTLEKSQKLKVFRQVGLNCRYVSMNLRRPPFDDAYFRRALSMAFDRNILVRSVLFGEGAPAGGLVPPGLTWAYDRAIPELATFNPARAQAELAKSKYRTGAKAVVLAWGSTWWKRFAELFVAQVNQTLGTALTVEVSDSNAVYSRLKAFDYDATVWGWLGLTDPDEYLGEILGTGAWRNFQGYSKPQFDALMAKGRLELDIKARGQIYRDADRMMLEDMPVIPCFVSNIHNLAVRNLDGFTQLPYSNFGDQFANLAFA